LEVLFDEVCRRSVWDEVCGDEVWDNVFATPSSGSPREEAGAGLEETCDTADNLLLKG